MEGKVDEVGYSRKSDADNDISATILIIIVCSRTGPFEAALSIPLPRFDPFTNGPLPRTVDKQRTCACL